MVKMMARYIISFECQGEVCHTTGEATYPTIKDFNSGNYSKQASDEMAIAFVDGYLDVKNLLGRVKPQNIHYTIEFPVED